MNRSLSRLILFFSAAMIISKGKLSTARSNLSLLSSDKSKGAHNHVYAEKIMAQASKDLDAVKTALK